MTGSIIYINDFCNQNCIFCCGRNKAMDRKTYTSIITKAKDRLIISGGEPPLSSNLNHVLGLAKKNKNISEVELQSNGAILFYKKMIGTIEKHNVITEYNINFSCFDKKTDKIITRSNLFNYRIQGIKNLLDKGLNIRLTFVIHKLNYKQMTDYLKFVLLKFDNKPSIQLSFVQIQGNEELNDIVQKYKEIKQELMKSLKFAAKNKIKCMVDNIPLCISYPFNNMNVDYLKNKKGDFSFHKKNKLNSCKKCKLGKCCFGPPIDYVNLYGEQEFKPIK